MSGRSTGILALMGLGLLGGTMMQARAFRAPESATPAASPPPAGNPSVAAEGRVVAYPGAEVRVGAETSGRLVRVLVREGEAVGRGELLAEIESDELRAALAEAEARVAEAEAEARLAELNLERRRKLFEEKILSAHELDQATSDVEIALSRKATARATAARHQAQLRKTRILAPIAGTVIARKIDAGQTTEAGAHAFTLADLSRLRIEGEAHEADAGAIAIGAAVRITADGFPGQSWRGRVEEIPDSMTLRRLKPQDPSRPTDTRVLSVKVGFAEPTPLKLGTTVELKIESAQ